MRRYLVIAILLVAAFVPATTTAGAQGIPGHEPGDVLNYACRSLDPTHPVQWYVSCTFDSAIADFATVGFGMNPDGLLVRGFIHEGFVAGDLDERGLNGGGDFDRTPRIRPLQVCRDGMSLNIPPAELNEETDEVGFCSVQDALELNVLMRCVYKPDGELSFLTLACEGDVDGTAVKLNVGDHQSQMFISTTIEGTGWVAATVFRDQSVQVAGGYTW